MQTETIILTIFGAIAALFILFWPRGMRTQGPRGPQGQLGPNQPSTSWPQQPANNLGPQQRSGYQGTPGGSYVGGGSRGGSSGLLQFFAIIGVLVILGACGLMILALQGAIQ